MYAGIRCEYRSFIKPLPGAAHSKNSSGNPADPSRCKGLCQVASTALHSFTTFDLGSLSAIDTAEIFIWRTPASDSPITLTARAPPVLQA
jgi:hypothetical protein